MPGLLPRSFFDRDPNADADPTYRMAMAPFGTYADPNGGGEHLGFAMPGMIQEPINALMRLGQNSRFEDGRLGIPNPQNLDNQHDTAMLIETLFGGNATRGAGAAESAAAHALPDVSPSLASIMEQKAALDAQRRFRKSIDTDWYHAAQPGFQQFEDPTDYLGVHVTRHEPTARDFQSERGGPLLRMDSPFENPFTLPDYESPGYADALKKAQEYLPNFDGTKESLERNAKAYRDILTSRGHDAIVSQDARLLDDPYEAIALNPKSLNDTVYSDTGKPSILGAAVAGAEKKPTRGYRGSLNPDNIARENAATLWGSASPEVASTYARTPYGDGPIGTVAPVDFNFQNPLVVDAGGNSWMNIPHDGGTINADSLAFRARSDGHDGLVIQNILDAANRMKDEPVLSPSTTYAALKRGTVTSPLTGETLFANGHPSLWGSALSQDQNEPRNSFFNY